MGGSRDFHVGWKGQGFFGLACARRIVSLVRGGERREQAETTIARGEGGDSVGARAFVDEGQGDEGLLDPIVVGINMRSRHHDDGWMRTNKVTPCPPPHPRIHLGNPPSTAQPPAGETASACILPSPLLSDPLPRPSDQCPSMVRAAAPAPRQAGTLGAGLVHCAVQTLGGQG